MWFRRNRPSRFESPRELERLSATLSTAVDEFGREMGRHRSRRKARQSRRSSMPARLSSLPGRRRWYKAVWHPMRLPQEYRRGVAPTVLSRDRERNGRPAYALEAEARAEGFAAAVRRQLLRLRLFLSRLRESFRLGRSPRVSSRIRNARSVAAPRRASGGGDGIVTVLVLAMTVGLGLDVIRPRTASAVEPQAQLATAVADDEALARRIDELAYAIAVAEGYFAAGIHDGRTLPFVLNNPGGLKKPTLGAADLPTWKDSGLVWFPTADAGWAALRHQVRLMLTGTSGIYAHGDSLISVGEKYADGDTNWGLNVATRLGVPPAHTLAELAAPEKTTPE
jgi:hypothetical protein